MNTSIEHYSQRESTRGRAAASRGQVSACLLALFLIHGLADTAKAQFFLPLGDLLEGTQAPNIYVSEATGISADGSTVVGFSKYPESGFLLSQPFRWAVQTGMVGLPPVTGYTGAINGEAFAVSADGSTVVGQMSAPDGSNPFRWTESGGMVSLGTLPGLLPTGRAHALSADGTLVAGIMFSDELFGGWRAFRWTQSEGMTLLDDKINNIFFGEVRAMPADGSYLVGEEHSETVRWSVGEPKVLLGIYPYSINAMTPDGSVLVGRGFQAGIRWTESGGLVLLPDLPGDDEAAITTPNAFDISANASLIVGVGVSDEGAQAVIWDSGNNVLELATVLSSMGIATTGWTLEAATGISDNGLRIVGYGIDPNGDRQAWLAELSHIPQPPPPPVIPELIPALAPAGAALLAAFLTLAGWCFSGGALKPGCARAPTMRGRCSGRANLRGR